MQNLQGTVLVVEDNDLERQALVTLLRLEGYEPYAAADAVGAMQFIDEEIDVVLSDLRMHGQTGVDLLHQWKAQRPATPFIFVTGVFEIAQVVEAVKLGAEDYITKPFNNSELLQRVADCIEAAHGHAYEDMNGDVLRFGALGEHNGHLDIPANATMEEIERIAIESALQRHRGNRTHAAEALGISVRTLQRKLKAWAAAS
ncbi:MAG TPA: response regulator [Lacipirellula sp.]